MRRNADRRFGWYSFEVALLGASQPSFEERVAGNAIIRLNLGLLLYLQGRGGTRRTLLTH
jgi:hypothetical protein